MILLITPIFTNLFDDIIDDIKHNPSPIRPKNGAISKGKPWYSWNGVNLKNQFKMNKKPIKGIVMEMIPNTFPVFSIENLFLML